MSGLTDDSCGGRLESERPVSHAVPAGNFRVFVEEVLQAQKSGPLPFPEGHLQPPTPSRAVCVCVCVCVCVHGLGFPLVRHGRMRSCVERQILLQTENILPGLLKKLVPRVIIFPELRARCSVTGSQAGLATGLSGCAAGMFIRVNRSGFVRFCLFSVHGLRSGAGVF